MTTRPKIHRHALYPICIFVASLGLVPLLILENRAQREDDSVSLTFSHLEGYYQEDILLEIRASHPEAEILYTLDGSIPTEIGSTRYTRPIPLNTTPPSVSVVRAQAKLPGGELGDVVSASFFMNLNTQLPVLSLIVNPPDLWDPDRGLLANPNERGQLWERPVVATYLVAPGRGQDDSTRQIGFHAPAGLRVHGGTTRANAEKKSMRLYFRQEYGPSRLNYPLFAQGTQSSARRLESFKRLVIHNGGQDYSASNWTLIRTSLMNDLASQLDVYTTQSQPALLFINGQPQGIFQLRDYIDDWFFADKYNLDAVEMLDAPFVVTGNQHWECLMDFLSSHDLADPANYAYIQTRVDIPNFADYAILQIYAANNDWLHHNVTQFRASTQGGRWNWILWDVDYSFGKAWQSYYDFNMVHWLYYEDRPNFERGSLLLRKLLDNPEFRAVFLSRTTDLLNTTLTPAHVISRIDALASELVADINYEVERWPHGDDWETSVEGLREFARRRPDAFRQNLIDGFGLEGTDAIDINPPLVGEGSVMVNNMLIPDGHWRGIYFRGSRVTITAVPAPGYRFAGWDRTELIQEPELTITVDESQTFTPLFEPAGNATFQPNDVVFSNIQVDGEDSEGDWFELEIVRAGVVDLRGWRITDNDTKTATDEGSLIFPYDDAFSRIPHGTVILVIATQTPANDMLFPQDDLSTWDRRMVVYIGNDHLDADTDPWFKLVPNDNLVLLAPGPTSALDDDQGIAFAYIGEDNRRTVTPASFGILADGVTSLP